MIEHGVKAPEFAGALGVFIDTLDKMEAELARQRWLSGARFGLADATLLPYALRLEHLAMDPLLDRAARPRVADWLARVKALPSYATAVEAWAVPAAVEMMRSNGKAAWPEVEPLTKRRAESWQAPCFRSGRGCSWSAADPVGLVVSGLLSQRGVPHLVVERRRETQRAPAAHVLRRRPMQILEQLGVADEVRRTAPPLPLDFVTWCATLGGVGGGPARSSPA